MNQFIKLTLILCCAAALLIGVGFGIFFGPALGSVISFLVKIVCAVFFDGALGNIALGMAIGAVTVLSINGLVTAVFLRRDVNKLGAKRPSAWSVL